VPTINAGANPDDLDHLAARFGQAASTVSSIQRSLNPQIMTAPWQGRSAERFRQNWNGQHRRAFTEAIAFLNKNNADLRRNAQEQRNASNAGGPAHTGGGSSGWGFVDRNLPNVSKWFERIGITGSVVSALAFAGSNRAVVGRYSDAWRALIKSKPFGVNNLLYFKRSPVLQAVNRLAGPASSPLSVLANKLKVLPYLSVGLSSVSAATSWRHGDKFEAGANSADMASTIVKTAGKTPVTYLVGVNMAVWTDVAREAKKVDWSLQGLRDLKAVSAADWGEVFSESVRKTPSKLFKFFF